LFEVWREIEATTQYYIKPIEQFKPIFQCREIQANVHIPYVSTKQTPVISLPVIKDGLSLKIKKPIFISTSSVLHRHTVLMKLCPCGRYIDN